MPEPKKRTRTRRAKDAPPSAQSDAAAASADTASPTGAPLKPGQLEAREDLRRNMLRSIITEPLLSKIQMDPTGTFDVIISLNELFGGGLAAALVLVKERATLWNVSFTEVSGYIFGRLQAPQIQQLAVESQQLNSENRRNEAVVYRIWEDSDIAVTLTRSLTTIKADAAQRSFHALGEGIGRYSIRASMARTCTLPRSSRCMAASTRSASAPPWSIVTTRPMVLHRRRSSPPRRPRPT